MDSKYNGLDSVSDTSSSSDVSNSSYSTNSSDNTDGFVCESVIAYGEVIQVQSVENFDDILEKCKSSNVKLVIDFYTTWCAPCKKLLPIFKDISEYYIANDSLMFVKVDLEECEELGDRYAISSIPAIKLFKNNKMYSYKSTIDMNNIIQFIDEHK